MPLMTPDTPSSCDMYVVIAATAEAIPSVTTSETASATVARAEAPYSAVDVLVWASDAKITAAARLREQNALLQTTVAVVRVRLARREALLETARARVEEAERELTAMRARASTAVQQLVAARSRHESECATARARLESVAHELTTATAAVKERDGR